VAALLVVLVILLAGGCNGTAASGPAAPTPGPAPDAGADGGWEMRADMPAPARTYPGVAAVGERVLVAGGFTTSPATRAATVYDAMAAYDTRTGTWTTLDPMPRPIAGPNVAGVGGQLFVLGGIDVVDSYAYDLAARRWSPRQPVPVTRGHGVAAVGVKGTTVYLAGGAQPGQSDNNLNTGVRVRDVLAYDTAADRWDRLPDLTLARGYAMGAVVGNTFWVIGGSSSRERTDDVVALDLGSRQWSPGPPPPLSLSSAGVAVLDGRIYIVGGIATSTGAIGPLTFMFDPIARSWDSGFLLNIPRFATGAAAVDGKIYFPAGDALVDPPATFAPVPTLEVFTP